MRVKTIRSYALFFASIFIPLFLSAAIFLIIPNSVNSNEALTFAKVFWLTGLLFAAVNLLGMLYGSPHVTDLKNIERYHLTGWPRQSKLIVSYVSKGDNSNALKRAVMETRKTLREMDVRYNIEIVTDQFVDVRGVYNYVVPADYATKKGAKYKARALQYLVEQRENRLSKHQDVWVLHLDEESIVTPEAIAGIAKFINIFKGQKVIGQGEIQYNAHNYAHNLLITVIDSIRTGDDLGRFRLQYKLFNKPLFGMHGSFILLPHTLEQSIGFDLTEKGSITEDAYFALIAMSRGYKFHWVDGFIREQSPFSLTALLKQRRRWIAGLKSLSGDNTIPIKYRWLLAINMILWQIAWVGPVVTLWNLLAGGSIVPEWMAILAATLSGLIGSVYMVGAWRNASISLLSRERKFVIWIASLILFPVACIVEGVAILYSMLRPVKTFQVVDK